MLGQEFARILWNPVVDYPAHKTPPFDPILCQMHPVHNLPFYFRLRSSRQKSAAKQKACLPNLYGLCAKKSYILRSKHVYYKRVWGVWKAESSEHLPDILQRVNALARSFDANCTRRIWVDRDSSISIVSRYKLDNPGIESRYGRGFPLPSCSTHSLL